MRFIHTADVHLGAVPNAGLLLNGKYGMELWENFERFLSVVDEKKADVLLIAGDLFHKPPTITELRRVDRLFMGLSKTKVVLIAGNHDCLTRDCAYRRYQWESDTYMIHTKTVSRIVLEEENLAVYGASYIHYENREAVFDNIAVAEEDKDRIKVLLAHGGDEKHIPMGSDMQKWREFSYVALGHIHKPEVVSVRKAAYSGALMPVDVNDTGSHGYIEGEVTKEGCSFRFVPFAAREYVHIVITLTQHMTYIEFEKKLSDMIKKQGRNHMYKVILKGCKNESIVEHKDWIMRSANIVEVEDGTEQEMNIELWKERYQDGVARRYIESFEGRELSVVEQKALKYGMEALAEADRS